MSGSASVRVDPRALLRAVGGSHSSARDWRRIALISGLAVVGLAAFGAVVVRANDDAGVLAFIKQQTAPASRSAPSHQGAAATRSYFPTSWARRPQREEQRSAAAQGRNPAPGRSVPQSMAFAPFGALPGPVQLPHDARPPKRPPAAVQATIRPTATPSSVGRGSAVAYCVRSCDGFFFPLGPSTGSDAGDAAACRSLCPASETRVYSRRIGEEMDDSRARLGGKRYSALPTAFQHRQVYDAACSCTGRGPGLATNIPASRDGTLRAGDAVMTPTGMKIFNGGRVPYREASFTPVRRSALIDSGTREALRKVEQASLPGRSGIAHQPLAKREAPAPKFAAIGGMDDATAPFRYVGPNGVHIR